MDTPALDGKFGLEPVLEANREFPALLPVKVLAESRQNLLYVYIPLFSLFFFLIA